MLEKLLLCTDLDRTLIPNGKQPESPNARKLFDQLVSHKQLTLTYVTGRDIDLVQQGISEYHLPVPDFVVADVGSTIYQYTEDQKWSRLKDWDDKIGVDWQNKTSSDLVSLFSDLEECNLQEKTKQGLHKLSYYISLNSNIENLILKINTRLKKEAIKSNIIWSIDEKAQMGLLDILPLSANKYYAIQYLMEKQDFNLENTFFSGDSGNDLDVLLSPIKSTLVANANEEIKEKVRSQISKSSSVNSIYIAEGGYLKMNGNYSAGILEGISHYFGEIDNLFN